MPVLNWLGREEGLQEAKQVPYRLLEPDAALSYGDADTGNMLIWGDNLEALKALLPHYAGKVKCIFIDPPYNTRNAFEHYHDNLEHAQWLNMMYPRLELLRELLAEEGSMWVTIDDDEGHYLKVILDEIFGRKNFVANVVWQKKYSPQNDARWLSDNHDHILIYAKDKGVWRPNLLPRSEDMDKRYKNTDNDPRGPWKSGDLSVKTYNANTDYPITTPSGRVVNPPKGRCWRVSKEKLEAMIAESRIWFGPDGKSVPAVKRFLTDVKQGTTPVTIWFYREVGHNQDAKQEVKDFDEDSVFDTPKPEKLIQRIIHLATQPKDLVLDSFLGSGTTAAVAHKMGRRYIGVEMGPHAKTLCAVRLKKVIEGEQGGISKSLDWKGGGGFRFYRLGEAVFDENGRICPSICFEHLAAHVYFSETGVAFQGKAEGPFLGRYQGTGYYLLYNGVLRDKRPHGGNVLTHKVLAALPAFKGPKVIYGAASRIGQLRLKEEHIVFRQTPYDVKTH